MLHGHCVLVHLQNANRRVTLNDFLDTLLADPGPPCLMWFPLMHRMCNVENGKILLQPQSLLQLSAGYKVLEGGGQGPRNVSLCCSSLKLFRLLVKVCRLFPP